MLFRELMGAPAVTALFPRDPAERVPDILSDSRLLGDGGYGQLIKFGLISRPVGVHRASVEVELRCADTKGIDAVAPLGGVKTRPAPR